MATRRQDLKQSAREFVWGYKQDHPCGCGEDHPAALTFHHLNPEEKSFSISWMIKQGFGVGEIMEEIFKCEVVCSNCHLKLHYEERYLD